VYAGFICIFVLLVIPIMEINSLYSYLASVNWGGILIKWRELVLNVEEMA